MVVDVSVAGPTSERATLGSTPDDLVDEKQLDRRSISKDVLPTLPVARATNVGALPSKKPANKSTECSSTDPPKTPTPSTNNARAQTPTMLPPLKPATPNTATRTKLIGSTSNSNSPTTTAFHCKLTPVQTAALLKPFWADLLANQIKLVRKHLLEHHLKKIDFDSARYVANADATPLHLCAQYGLMAMAKMLVGEFGLAPTLRNKVGSTPLHVACKWAKNDVVSWLIDELHVPLDVPDAQHHTALDVAPFDTVVACVLAPLYQQHDKLTQREAVLMEEDQAAQDRLAQAQLVLRQRSMMLSDTESHQEDERRQIVEVRDLERYWHDQWQAREAVLDELLAQYGQQREELAEEERRARDLYDQEVKSVHDEHVRAQRELEELEALVETTQRELNRRQQLLVDQLGVFDASLRVFGGSRDVQQWVVTTLLAIARDDNGEATGAADKAELLLRAESVDAVRHVLTTFPTDYELQYEALALLVAVLRLHTSSSTKSSCDLFVTAVVDSDLLLQLGALLVRWHSDAETNLRADKMTFRTLEAMYLCLRLRRNAQLVLAFCQNKDAQLVALHVLEKLSRFTEEDTITRRSLMGYTALVLLTQATYGVKKVLLKAGVVRTMFETLQRISTDPKTIMSDNECNTDVEIAHYLFATLALLMSSSSSTKEIDTRLPRCVGKCREPRRLEDLTTDAEPIRAAVIIDCIQKCVLSCADHRLTNATTLWAFKLLVNISNHGGEPARRVRQELLTESDDHDPLRVLVQAVKFALATERPSELANQVVLAGLDTFRVVWIERFGHEGRIEPSRVDVVKALPEITASLIERLLVSSYDEPANALVDLAASLHTLTSAAQNARNAVRLISHDVSTETVVLKPILQWTFGFVDETGTSYREPSLVAVLARVLKLFMLLTQARRVAQSAYLQTASSSDVAGFHRHLHAQSHDIGICAVLKVFRAMDAGDATPPDWTALLALCTQIQELLHCTC